MASKEDNAVEVSPGTIRFSQKSIDSKFKDHRKLLDTLEEILASENPEQFIKDKIQNIEIKRHSDGYYVAARGNRRLYLYKLLQKYEVINKIRAIVNQNYCNNRRQSVYGQEVEFHQEKTLEECVKKYLERSKSQPVKEPDIISKSDERNIPEEQNTGASKPKRRRSGVLKERTNIADQSQSLKPKSAKKSQQEKGHRETDINRRPRKRKSPETEKPTTRSSTEASKHDDESPKRLRATPPSSLDSNTKDYRAANNEEEEEEESKVSPRDHESSSPEPGLSQPTSGQGTTGASQEMEDLTFD